MHIDFYGLAFDTAQVTFHLWSPWRAAAIEHRLFEAVRSLPGVKTHDGLEECHLRVADPRTWKAAMQAVARVLKGWQEEAGPGGERRVWRWLVEADTDPDGFDHNGEPVSLWGFLRLSLDRGAPGEAEKGEDLDLEGFGVRIWGSRNGESV